MTRDYSDILNLSQDERIIYRTKAGKFSFLGFLPGVYLIATNRRLFILSKKSIRRSYFYERISSVDIKSGLLNSKFIINVLNENNQIHSGTVAFYNKGHAMIFFSVISNQIKAMADPYNRDRQRAQELESRYNVMSKSNTYIEPEMENTVLKNAQKSAKKPAAKKIQIQTRLVEHIEQPVTATQIPEAKPKQEIVPQTTKLGKGVSSLTQKMHKQFKDFKTIKPEEAVVDYSAGDMRVVMEKTRTQKQKRKGPVVEPPEIDPDADLKIFSIRRMKGVNIKNSDGRRE